MTTLAEIYVELRIAYRKAGGQGKWAKANGVTPQYVSDVLNARRDPGPKILGPLGFVEQITYARIRKP